MKHVRLWEPEGCCNGRGGGNERVVHLKWTAGAGAHSCKTAHPQPIFKSFSIGEKNSIFTQSPNKLSQKLYWSYRYFYVLSDSLSCMNYCISPQTGCDVTTEPGQSVMCECVCGGGQYSEAEGNKPTSQYPWNYKFSDNSISFLWILVQ